jgi:hypothetical protein
LAALILPSLDPPLSSARASGLSETRETRIVFSKPPASRTSSLDAE